MPVRKVEYIDGLSRWWRRGHSTGGFGGEIKALVDLDNWGIVANALKESELSPIQRKLTFLPS